MVSDVRVGLFLSGGLDSAAILALAPRGLHTFTIGFDDSDRSIEHFAGSGIHLHRGTSSLGSFGCEVIGERKVGRLVKK